MVFGTVKADWPNHKLTCSGRKGGTAHPQAKKTKSLHPAQKEIQELTVAAMRCARAGDRVGEGRAYCDLGAAYLELGQFHKAVEFHRKGLDIAQELGNKSGLSAAYSNLGNAYRSLGQFDKAVEFHRKHLNIALGVGDRAEEGRAYRCLFAAYSRLGVSDKAAEFRQKYEKMK